MSAASKLEAGWGKRTLLCATAAAGFLALDGGHIQADNGSEYQKNVLLQTVAQKIANVAVCAGSNDYGIIGFEAFANSTSWQINAQPFLNSQGQELKGDIQVASVEVDDAHGNPKKIIKIIQASSGQQSWIAKYVSTHTPETLESGPDLADPEGPIPTNPVQEIEVAKVAWSETVDALVALKHQILPPPVQNCQPK